MDLYASGQAVGIHYPTGQIDAQNLANELAARLDELVSNAASPFSQPGQIGAGIPASDVEAIYVGRQQDWVNEIGNAAAIPWWRNRYDFGIKVVSGVNRLNPLCTGSELHIIARDSQLLLRAVWLALHAVGWRHYMPNGVSGLEDVWVYRSVRDTISTTVNRVWAGVVDYLHTGIAGGTSNIGWSTGDDHGILHPNGLMEGDLQGAIGDSPLVEANPDGTWLRHMGWTASSTLSTNAAWGLVVDYDTSHAKALSLWDDMSGVGEYTTQDKLYTDSPVVQQVALDYANNKVSAAGVNWVSLARADGDGEWNVDFGDATFGAKAPVTRQIELANHVATSAAYTGAGIVIQAYGDTAETPTDGVWPHPSEVCVMVIEAYRPPGKTIEEIVDDYVDIGGHARCPLGLYQYLYSGAWGVGVITAKAADPQELVEAVNRVKHLPTVSPKVLTGEAMTDFGLYGLGYYCYMRMVLDIGRVSADFTLADFTRESDRFFADMFPTRAVRTAIKRWYDLLLDMGHKPLLSSHLLRGLWDRLHTAMNATSAGSDEEKRVTELCKYTRYLDLRNRYEAADATGSLDAEGAYDLMMEWVFRIRDTGLVDAYNLFQFPLNRDHHDALGLDTIWGPLNDPPGDFRGSSGTRAAWITTQPQLDDFNDPGTNWIADGVANNSKHGLTQTTFSTVLEGGWITDARSRMADTALHPYRADGKMKLWLIPGDSTFECEYRVDDGGAYVEFVNQATGAVDAAFPVTVNGVVATSVTVGQLYEIRLTTYGTSDRIWLDWWSVSIVRHYLSFDPGREGDPCGFGGPTGRSYYFLVPDGVSEINFYASVAENLQLFYLDEFGVEQEDTTFAPMPRSYQPHTVTGTGRRVMRIDGIQINEIGFWLLNCPNLFALHPEELLKPADA
jgi:hypothetical protein